MGVLHIPIGCHDERTHVTKLSVGKFETIVKNKKLTDKTLLPIVLDCVLEGMTVKLQLTKFKRTGFEMSCNGRDY